MISSSLMSSGSSPLARGAQGRRKETPYAPGLIPARAGSTANLAHPQSRKRAHPRSRGEHLKELGIPVDISGSSPLARGAPPAPCARASADGLIPARAGSTTAIIEPSSPLWAHPRSRGEHSFPLPTSARGLGSSPLARGAHTVHGMPPGQWGLIPARAGSTRSWARSSA